VTQHAPNLVDASSAAEGRLRRPAPPVGVGGQKASIGGLAGLRADMGGHGTSSSSASEARIGQGCRKANAVRAFGRGGGKRAPEPSGKAPERSVVFRVGPCGVSGAAVGGARGGLRPKADVRSPRLNARVLSAGRHLSGW